VDTIPLLAETMQARERSNIAVLAKAMQAICVDSNAVLDKTMQRGVLMTDKNTIPYSDIPDELIDSWYEELESEEEEDYPTDEEIAEIMSELYKDEQ